MEFKDKIKALAERNRMAATQAEKDVIEAEMKRLEQSDPKAFTEALEDLIKSTSRKVEELTVAEKMGEISNMLSMAYIARTYFGKTRSWLAHKLHGDIVNGKPSSFTDEELNTLKSALDDMSKKIGSLSVSL